ncbi:MAG: Gp37 family protein [Burkholderiaceae bacterium]|jgi:hypothetical protein|nr:Gp37 family protein [Burkholderiaceae bacterium]
MVTIGIVEAIISRLQERLPGLAVTLFPDKPVEYRLNHPVGALLVSYLGSQFATTLDTGFVVQPRTVRLSVTVVLRQLNGADGAIAILDQVRLALVGFCPPSCRKLRAVEENFLDEDAGIWQFAVDFSTETVQVEYVPQENNEPCLATIGTAEEEPD